MRYRFPKLLTAFVIGPTSCFVFDCHTRVRVLYPERDEHGYCREVTKHDQLKVMPDETFIIVPVGQVQRAFATGRRKLPTELKVETLSYNLAHD